MISASTDALLNGLGCNMTAKAPKDLLPEECLSLLSTRVLEDPKALILLNAAIQTNKSLLHPEMLLKCLKEFEEANLKVIGALLTKTEDRRFAKVISHCKSSKQKPKKPAPVLSLAARIGQTKFDKDFKKFGIKIAELPIVDSRKISSPVRLLRHNLFFKNRVLFGCNWRADIISCIELGIANPSDIKRRLSCSYETAHRIFNDYQMFMQSKSNF